MINSDNQKLQLQLVAYLEHNMPRYLEEFQKMVTINSFTANPQGVNELGELTASLFSELGFESREVPSGNPMNGDHLVLTRTSERNAALGTIALISHLDTVYPPEEEERNQFQWREEGDLIYGPGTVDIKGGTMMAFMVLDAMRFAVPHIFSSVNWYVLLDAAEEELAPEFKDLCQSVLPPQLDACLVFEGGQWNGQEFDLVTSRKGRITYEITINGRAAHAGSAYKKGANAIIQLAEIVGKVADLTNIQADITFNVGVIEGGTVANRVPHYAKSLGEARAFSAHLLDQGVKDLESLQKRITVSSIEDGFPCQIEIEVLGRWQPWPENRATKRLFSIWEQAAGGIGYQVRSEQRGGLSDGNWLWEMAPTLDGLGPAGGNAHCSERSPDGKKEQEYVLKSSFVPKAAVNALALYHLLTGAKGDIF